MVEVVVVPVVVVVIFVVVVVNVVVAVMVVVVDTVSITKINKTIKTHILVIAIVISQIFSQNFLIVHNQLEWHSILIFVWTYNLKKTFSVVIKTVLLNFVA